jgi:hypothetical protein
MHRLHLPEVQLDRLADERRLVRLPALANTGEKVVLR